MLRKSICLALLALATFASAMLRVDLVGNHPMTDRTWFYTQVLADGSTAAKDEGGGQYYDGQGEHGTVTSTMVCDHFCGAYTRGSAVKMRIRVGNSGAAYTGTVTIAKGLYIGTDPSPWFTGGSGTVSVPANGVGVSSLITVGTLPNTVGISTALYEITVTGPNGVTESDSSQDVFYRTYSAPTGHMAVPWAEVLIRACAWAEGADTQAETGDGTTYGLFYGDIFYYNLGELHVPTKQIGSDGFFKLKDLLNTVANSRAPGSCVDISAFNSLLMEAIGLSPTLKQLFPTRGIPLQDDAMITNLICPIGSDSSDPSLYSHVIFTMHQQAWLGTDVYDAALSYKKSLADAIHMNPAGGWPMPDYWWTVVATSPRRHTGLVHSYADYYSTDTGTGLPVGSGTWVVPSNPAEAVNYRSTTVNFLGVR